MGAGVPGWLGVLAVLSVLALGGCAPSGDPGGGGTRIEHDVRDGSEASDPVGPMLDGDDLVLLPPAGGEPRHLASLAESDGEVVHLSLRPGEHDVQVVLALTRVRDDGGLRYELRYLVVDGDEVTDLYWFPWRLQVDEDTAELLDTPPLPVWAPDGGAVAWIEWDTNGTRLRTVGWLDHEEGSNPSDDTSALLLAGVGPGAQLSGWSTPDDGTDVLTGRFGGERLEIRIERGLPHVRWPDRAPDTGASRVRV